MSLPLRWEMPHTPERSPAFQRPPRPHQPSPARALRFWARLGMGSLVLWLAVVGAWSLLQSATVPRTLSLVSHSTLLSQMALASATAERSLGFVTITGSAVNRANKKLSQVEAVVELLDRQNHPLRIESALVTLDPLSVGEVTPFHVEMTDHPNAVSFRVRFKRLMGAALN